MLRTLFARLALIATAVAAGPAGAEDLEAQAALLKMIRAGDVGRVEAHFDALQARAEAGEIDPEDDYSYVNRFTSSVKSRFGFPDVLEAVNANKVAWAQERADLDPYNPKVIRGLMASREVRGRARIDLHARNLRVSPFDPDLWFKHGGLLGGAKHSDPARYFEFRGPLTFAAAITDQRHDITATMMLNEIQGIEALEAEQELHPELFPPEWTAFLDHLDRETDYICPVIRAGRFFQPTCETTPHAHGCDKAQHGLQHASLERLQSEAKQRGICWQECLAPIEELAFTIEEAMAEPGMAELLGR